MQVTIREIDAGNFIEAIRLEVRPEQKQFVASNAASIAQSKFLISTTAASPSWAWTWMSMRPDPPLGFVIGFSRVTSPCASAAHSFWISS